MLVYAFLIQALGGPDFYYVSLQEDESLEWATFWAFLLAAGAFGVANTVVSRLQRQWDPETLATARVEVQALKDDILARAEESHDFPVRCNVSKRLDSFVDQYDAGYLMRGRFAALVSQGLPAQRAEFLLDPWNHPYWIRSRCTKDFERRVFVCSFGPNRKRDSTQWELLEDDEGLYLARDDFDPEPHGVR